MESPQIPGPEAAPAQADVHPDDPWPNDPEEVQYVPSDDDPGYNPDDDPFAADPGQQPIPWRPDDLAAKPKSRAWDEKQTAVHLPPGPPLNSITLAAAVEQRKGHPDHGYAYIKICTLQQMLGFRSPNTI